MRRVYARTPNLYPRQNGPFWEHCFREQDVRPELSRANQEIDKLHRMLWEKRKAHVRLWLLELRDHARDRAAYSEHPSAWARYDRLTERLHKVIRMEYPQ